MVGGARAASRVLDTYRDVLDAVRARHPDLVRTLQTQLQRRRYRTSATYLMFCRELAASLAADAAHDCGRATEQYLALGECRTGLMALIELDLSYFIAALLDAYGAPGCRERVLRIVEESVPRFALVTNRV